MNAPTAPILSKGLADMPDAAGATPVMAQFFEAKARQPDALVFFRMGDFYELFFEDAVKAAAALGIAQTFRGTHAGSPIPMAGVPVHAAEAYLAKLIRAGFKVAVCEQMEDPAEARKRGSKSVVRRDLVRVVTPGTLTEDSLLDARGANRLAAVAVRAGQAAVASVELSTGQVEVLLTSVAGLAAALASLQPSETLVPDPLFADAAVSAVLKTARGVIQPLAGAPAEPAASDAPLQRLYLLAAIDRRAPAPGARLLAARLARPLLSTEAIEERLDAVDWLLQRRELRGRVRERLKGAGDMARALTRLALGRGGPRDLGGLRDGLLAGEAITGLFATAQDALQPPPREIASALDAASAGPSQDLRAFFG